MLPTRKFRGNPAQVAVDLVNKTVFNDRLLHNNKCLCYKVFSDKLNCNCVSCLCNSCNQGETASLNNNKSCSRRSVKFNGCQSHSGNSEGTKSCVRDFMPVSRINDYKPFYNNTSGSRNFSGITSSSSNVSDCDKIIIIKMIILF